MAFVERCATEVEAKDNKKTEIMDIEKKSYPLPIGFVSIILSCCLNKK